MGGRRLLRGLTALATLVLLLGVPLVVAAHEQHHVGPYTVEMGWRDEPALEGAVNAVYLEVQESASSKPVEGLAKTLRVQVSFGGGAQVFEPVLHPSAETPGAYVGDIIPTRAGDYIFHLTGTIGDLKVDERFETGPGRFDPVSSPTSLQFPDQLGSDANLAGDLQAVRDSDGVTRLIAIGAVLIGLASAGVVLRSRSTA